MKIIHLRVPSQYILEKYEISAPLILDCEYDLPVDEQGLVLKWYLNDQLIYHWISSVPPRIFVHVSSSVISERWIKIHRILIFKFKNLIRNIIDLNQTVVEHKQPNEYCSTLRISKPTFNMTGTYTCLVGTFQSEDKRSSHLQIIAQESEFILNVKEENDGSNDISVQCSAHAIYPEPKLLIR